MPESTSSRRAAVRVSADVQLFDFQVVYSFTSDGYDVSCVDSGEQASAGPRRPRALIVAKALIDPRRDWRLPGPVGPEPVAWLAPGPLEGAFGLSILDHPAAIPCDVWMRCRSDAEVQFAREDAARAGWGPDQLTQFAGWASITYPRWKGDLGTAFPDEKELADSGATERANRYLDPARLEDRLLRDGPALPFVVSFGPSEFVDDLTLNPDALEGLVLALPEAQWVALQRVVENGRAGVGLWSGDLLIAPGDFEVVAVDGQVFSVATRDSTATLRRKRFEYALGCLYREARLAWQHRLPVVRHWQHSAVHRVLRDSLPALARQSLREQWNADRRREVLESVCSLILDSRVGLTINEKRLNSRAADLVVQGDGPASMLPAIRALRSAVRKARARRWWGRLTSALFDAVLFSALGFWVGGWRGLVIGLVAAWVVEGLRRSH